MGMVNDPVVAVLAMGEPEIHAEKPGRNHRHLGRSTGIAPSQNHGQIDEQLTQARRLGQDAEKHKVKDIGGHYAHGDAVDALGSQVEMFHDPDDVIPAVTQHSGQPRPQQPVHQGQGADDGQGLPHDPATGLG